MKQIITKEEVGKAILDLAGEANPGRRSCGVEQPRLDVNFGAPEASISQRGLDVVFEQTFDFLAGRQCCV
jgi:hypothetical protein